MLTLTSLIIPKTKRTLELPVKINYVNRHYDALNFEFANNHGMKIRMTGKLYKEAFGEIALQNALQEIVSTLTENDVRRANKMIHYK